MKRIWKENEGVSPVIATILMVAITVVLAAVLYVMVMGITINPKTTPSMTWNDAGAESSTEGKLVFGAMSYEVQPLEIKIFVKANGTSIGTLSIPTNNDPSPQDINWLDGPDGASARYFDYSPSGAHINQGDYIELYGLSPGTSYSFEVFYNPTEDLVIGADTSFITP